MQRIRTVKPEIARHEGLFEAEQASGLPLRFAWVMLFTVCDREGRFKWRPRSLKPMVLPFDDVDFAAVLTEFHRRGFLQRYRVGDEWYGWIPTFTTHQFINGKEGPSELPPFEQADEVTATDATSSTRDLRVSDACRKEGKGKERNGREGISSLPLRVTEPASPAVLTFPTIGSGEKTWALTERQVEEWRRLYPGLDVLGECRKALAWVQAKGQPKTAKGMPSFLVKWFNRAVDDGRVTRGAAYRPAEATTGREGWVCSHVEPCKHQAMCRHKDAMPVKYPKRSEAHA
jgi:hypothetical protein